MKKIFKRGILILLLAMAFTMFAPSAFFGNSQMSTVAAANVKISTKKLTLTKGESKKLKIKGTNKKVKWNSSKKSVATVNKNGKVTAKKKGTATITAKVGRKKYSCKITVENPKINIEMAIMDVGDKLTLKISGTSQTVTWASDNKAVATVTGNGVVTARSPGSAIITAKIGNKKYKCEITVDAESGGTGNSQTINATGITLNNTSLTLIEGDTVTLSATITPSNTTNKNVTWSSSDSNIVKVNSSGNLTAVSQGTATVTAKVGNVSASCRVTVNSYLSQFSSAEIMAAYSTVVLEAYYVSPSQIISIYYGTGAMFADSMEKEVVMIGFRSGTSTKRAMLWNVKSVSPIRPTIETQNKEYIQLSDAGNYVPSDLSNLQALDITRVLSAANYIKEKGIYMIYLI